MKKRGFKMRVNNVVGKHVAGSTPSWKLMHSGASHAAWLSSVKRNWLSP
jgi:hypothetical protein